MSTAGVEELPALMEENAEKLAAGIIEEWREIGQNEVWLSLPSNMDFDHLPAVLRALARATFAPRVDRDLARALTGESAQHGSDRQEQGFQESYLYTEYMLLRRSIWELFQEHLTPSEAYGAIVRADALISLSTLACLRGFHRLTYEARGDWPATLDRLVEEWPLIRGRGP
ncbi:MAG: hypothetical protein KY466_00160 [Gemmatimonadetes bacterium]|nr:hypothetical protein [Gemmatimonadota bacterium]